MHLPKEGGAHQTRDGSERRGHVDASRLDVVARMHGGGWYTTVSPFRLDRITLADSKSQSSDAAGAFT